MYDLLQFSRSGLEPVYLAQYAVHRFRRNFGRSARSGKIPETFKASGFEAFQPVAYPFGTSQKIGGCIIYAHFTKMYHVYCKHSGSHPVVLLLLVCLFEFFPCYFDHAALEDYVIYIVSGLMC